MKLAVHLPVILLLAPLAVLSAPDESIDRRALVKRHNIEWNDLHGQIPLGNGEFCFNADATGLQTFGGSTLAHWGWHSAPLPPGCTPAEIPPTGCQCTRSRLQKSWCRSPSTFSNRWRPE